VAGLGGLAWIREVLLPFRPPFRKIWTVSDQSKRLGFLDEFTREFQPPTARRSVRAASS
jgi:hypothetical protein